MTLKQLEAFYWAAKLGTFSIAARRLHVTQSSLSKRIAELEADLDEALFDRSSRRAVLTPAGELLLETAGQMLELERSVRSQLDRQEQTRGICRFGLTEFAATTWFPALASRVSREHPAITLEPQVGLSRSLENAVVRGELDVAAIAGPSTNPEVLSQQIAQVEFVWTAAPALQRRNMLLSPGDFLRHPVINSTHESGLTSVFESWASANGIKVAKTIACNSRSAIIALTVAGVGLSFQPRQYVLPLFERKLLVPLRSEPPLPILPYSFIWRRDDNRRLVPLFRRLVDEEVDFGPDVLH